MQDCKGNMSNNLTINMMHFGKQLLQYCKGLASVGYEMSSDPGVASVLPLHTDLQGVNGL